MNWFFSLSHNSSCTLFKKSLAYDVSTLLSLPFFISKLLMYSTSIFELEFYFLKFFPESLNTLLATFWYLSFFFVFCSTIKSSTQSKYFIFWMTNLLVIGLMLLYLHFPRCMLLCFSWCVIVNLNLFRCMIFLTNAWWYVVRFVNREWKLWWHLSYSFLELFLHNFIIFWFASINLSCNKDDPPFEVAAP